MKEYSNCCPPDNAFHLSLTACSNPAASADLIRMLSASAPSPLYQRQGEDVEERRVRVRNPAFLDPLISFFHLCYV
ncbi:MAG TPA: hypothetical protein VGM31_23045 [Puia sp.]